MKKSTIKAPTHQILEINRANMKYKYKWKTFNNKKKLLILIS